MAEETRFQTGFRSEETGEPGLVMHLDGTVWLVAANGDETQVGSGGGSGNIFVQNTDPGAIGAGNIWVNTGASPAELQIRNATDDGWQGSITNLAVLSSYVIGGGACDINFSPATLGPGGTAPFIGVQDVDGNLWEIAFQNGMLGPEVDTLGAGISLGAATKQWKDLYFTGQLIPASPPVVPQTLPSVQNVIDALVAIGLVVQHD